jgi:hypothetical protein
MQYQEQFRDRLIYDPAGIIVADEVQPASDKAPVP